MKANAIRLALVAGLTLGSAAALAQATEGPWMMRIRAVNIKPIEKSDAIPALGLPSDDIYVEDRWIPEVDFTYFFTKNIAAELILTYPQQLDVKSKAAGKLGKFDALPPTLTLQYHFAPEGTFRPYVGAGINYTRISSVNLGVVDNLTGGKTTLSDNSVGAALQIGFDYKIGNNSYINVDLKKVFIEADVKVNGAKVSKVTLDPLLVGIGWGFRF
jgi:outer membrane protein